MGQGKVDMARFDYLEARTLRQAISLGQRYGLRARFVAGSTDFLIRWRQGVWQPEYVINIQHISSLSRVSYNSRDGLRLGSLVTVQTLESHPIIRRRYPALSASAASFAGVQVRNLATVGGNVCNASPAGDTLPALLAFEASCRIAGPGGERWLPLDQFFTGPGQTALEPGEVLAELRLPPPLPDTGSLYIKHSPRGGMDIATLGVASVVSLQEQGSVFGDVKIALGAVAPTPIRAYTAEEMLRGRAITPELIGAAAAEAESRVTPIDDLRGSALHRKSMVRVLTQRTLERAVDMARKVPMPFELQRSLAVQAVF
ncbi:MAG: xanthine dehydrogenase family protein subunit M [Chloroflexi bacterium]|nr:xanthine dehydrogenase family protein subunit M [Chloroflexota bacterium]MCI0780107.1 xanthine dehydrogenase family protein subunit M [Chloroflexota bacterium]MCI0785094.1 xanthine dehydrogenase family protein subunit M [Chloroflexota bacterium]MCI0793252.1 xanthine dehydrogenase family protein subunit M [Chloroflexota bacterium]MCI0798157.1 xanthine dehydrogenase family protein subunit M [Chloroflexota bacterium]